MVDNMYMMDNLYMMDSLYIVDNVYMMDNLYMMDNMYMMESLYMVDQYHMYMVNNMDIVDIMCMVNLQKFFWLLEFATWHFRLYNVDLVQCTKLQWYIVVMLYVPVNFCQYSLCRLHLCENTTLPLSQSIVSSQVPPC